MSHESSNSDWLQEALESTRRNVRQLEIDAYRIRTDLARIEVANAAGVANGVWSPPVIDDAGHRPQALLRDSPLPVAEAESVEWQQAAPNGPAGMEILIGAPPRTEHPSEFVEALPDDAESISVADLTSPARRSNRRAASPVMTSLVVHGAILLLTFSITVATIEHHDEPFTATFLNLPDEPQTELSKPVESVDDHQLRDLGETVAQDSGVEVTPTNLVTSSNEDAIPLDLKSIDGPVSVGGVGPLDPLTTDMGTLLTGGGGMGDGKGAPTGLGTGNQRGRGAAGGGGRKAGGRLDTTLFFGTEARGDRFVFVVDNSSSMKGGRLEMAVAELRRTIDALSPRQSFYVIFVSDQTYPMFYPEREPALVTATPVNKKRLTEWAPKAILASGKNRELIKAMDFAASLGPQAVYLLWDGDLRYSEKVRTDVMMHLTQPNQWKFIIHTLGMGITSLDSEQNLTAIARAHNGIYRRIDLPPVRTR